MALSTPLFTDVHSGLGYDPTTQTWTTIGPVDSSSAHPALQWTVPAEWHIPQGTSSRSTLFRSSTPGSSASSESSPSSRASSPTYLSAPSSSATAKKPSVSRRRAKDPNHIPRPRNAFIIFRSVVCNHVKHVESDHRMISRIVGDMWKKAPKALRAAYKGLAAMEKEQHALFYPNYRFAPQQRATPAKKRKVKRNGESDKQRCIRVAELLLEGKGGDDLKAEVTKFDEAVQEQALQDSKGAEFSTGVFDSKAWPATPPPPSPSTDYSSASDETPFRSPLLPPATPASLSTFSIPPSTPSEALSPLDLMPTNQTQAPTLGVVPLPDLADDSLLSQPSDYSCLQSALGSAPATSYGAMQAHEHASSSLALSHMYSPRTAPFMMAAHNEDYSFRSEPFVHDLDIAMPVDPAVQTTFAFAPDAQVFHHQQQQQLAYGHHHHHYALVDPASQHQPQSQPQTEMQLQTPRAAEGQQAHAQQWVFPSGEIPSFEPFATAAAPGHGQQTVYVLGAAWGYAGESGLDVASQAQNLSAHAWMQ